jgi:Domain of unknown function (DUF4189)
MACAWLYVLVMPAGAQNVPLGAEKQWDDARASRDPVAVSAYIKAHPDSPHYSDAIALRDTLIAELEAAELRKDWRAVEGTRDLKVLRAFLAKHPQSEHTSKAKYFINLITEQEAQAGIKYPPSALDREEISNEVQHRLYELRLLSYDAELLKKFLFAPRSGRRPTELTNAIKAWQHGRGLRADGTLTAQQLIKLRADMPPKSWAAIAVSLEAQFFEMGTSRVQAEQAAESMCRKQASRAGTECLVASVTRGECLAVAASGDNEDLASNSTVPRKRYFYAAVDSDQAYAEGNAMAACRRNSLFGAPATCNIRKVGCVPK